ncbi:hypothetical protein GALMADRAFT_218038 [Galerina marginata CBS 339.88]|uniref:Uncharacterized protein n=1 Tax=Galerina marginata (strain CBS 339.88) TaxID=685588 RepID=A0A067TYC3_GALM3|nr:hypothetical protein GALMADRAFT_218038 [Galerina marginata CBS 339.88]
MILEHEPDDKKRRYEDADTGAQASSSGAGSSSNVNLNEASDHALIDMVPNEPPPSFAPYQAEHFEVGYSDVVSHDPHLNSDGEALYRFLLAQSASVPTHRLHCNGTHTETRTRWVSERDSHGRTRSRQERYNETVTDFDFCIDITPGQVDAGLTSPSSPSGSTGPRTVAPIQWSVADDEPAYRGKMVREYEVEPYSPVQRIGAARDEWSDKGRRAVHRKEAKAFQKWAAKRSLVGFPPWTREADVENRLVLDPAALSIAEEDTLRSSKTLRQWADEYCESPKYLKEFVYEKIAYGWNMEQIENAVRATIRATPYNGSLNVTLVPHNTKIYIRPDNRVSRMLSNKWLKVLSWILLIFPFIWLFKRFHSRGGGRWEVCGGAYPLKQWVPVQTPEEETQAAAAAAASAAQGGDSDSNRGAGAGVDDLPPYSDAAGPAIARTTSSSSQRQQRLWFTQTPTGPKKLVGVKEGEWFKSWEGAIARAVIGRYQSNLPLPRSTRSLMQVRSLDGYDEAPASRLVDY